MIEGLGHHILPKIIHTSSWGEIRQVLRVPNASREDSIENIKVKDGDGDNLLHVALSTRTHPDILLNLITTGGKIRFMKGIIQAKHLYTMPADMMQMTHSYHR